MKHFQRLTLSAAAWSVLLVMQSCGGGSEGALRKGQENLQAGKYADAEIQFRKVLSEDAQNQAAKVGLAQSLSQQGNVLAAWDAYREAEKGAPNDVQLLLERIEIGYAALRNGPSRMRSLEQEVTDLCNKALRLKPDAAPALRSRAYLSLRLGDVAVARKDYEAAFAAAPQDVETLKALFAIWVNEGQNEKAIGTVREILAKNPRFEEGYRILYGYYTRRQQFAEGRAVLEAKHKVFGANSESVLELALHEERAGNAAGAQQLLAELEAKRPGTAKYRMDVAGYYARLGRWDEALAQVEKGMQGFPAQKMVFAHEKARLLFQKGLVREAADLLAATYAEFPKNTALLQEETQMRVQLSEDPEQRGKADLLFAKLRSMDPIPAGTEALYVRFLQGSNRIEDARKVMAEGVKKYPNDAELLLLQARQALAVAAPAKAMNFASRAFRMRPSSPEAAALFAECFISNGVWQGAVDLLEDWRESNRPSNEIDILLAAAYAGQKKLPQAKEMLEKVSKRKLSSTGQVIAMARAWTAVGDSGRALALIDSELRTRTNSAALLEAKAGLLEQAGRAKEALVLVRQLMEQRPSGELLLQVARLEGGMGNLSAAAAAIEKAEQVAPGNVEVALAKTALLEAQDKYREAEGILRGLHNAEPRSGRIANALAWNLAMQGRAAEAKPIAVLAVKEDGTNLNYRDTEAWISLQLKELNQAKAAYQELVRQDAQNAAFHFHLVEALLALKDPTAKTEYAKAMSKGAIPAECKDISSRIKAYDIGGI
ncbi:tetratricopeptide repeat protein [Nostoc sp. NIES-2111]